ncbi:MAG: hypothetical protein AAF264_04005 [Pseudomonadota bacterium]
MHHQTIDTATAELLRPLGTIREDIVETADALDCALLEWRLASDSQAVEDRVEDLRRALRDLHDELSARPMHEW